MKLQVGQKAIDFDKETFDGQRVHLAALQGKRILLSFFRNTACPFCNLRVHQLSKLHPELKAQGLEMVFFFESSNKTILRSSFHSGLSPISLIGDPDKEVYRAYGVESNLLKMASTFLKPGTQALKRQAVGLGLQVAHDKGADQALIPADFLIGEDQRIVEAHYGSDIKDHLDLERIKHFAAQAEGVRG